MKVRFYPSKAIVLKLLDGRIGDAESNLLEDRAALQKANESRLVGVADVDHLMRMVEADEQVLDDLKTEYLLLESHAPQEVMCEIEL